MSSAAVEGRAAAELGAGSRLAFLKAVPLWGWWAAAFAIIAVRAVIMAATADPSFLDFYGDTDDATRLIEVREFMAGAPWFDIATYKMGGIGGMYSHWSRLIDLPIAAILAALELVLSRETSEALVRTVWPLAVFAPLLWALLRAVTTASGETAGRIALLLAAFCPLGFYQFDVGRLDHHNVMIAATVSAALILWAYPRSLHGWLAAGGLSGLALAVGYEALAPVAALATFAALWGLIDPRQAKLTRAFTLALMFSIAAGFFLTIPPSRWTEIHCDAISLNFVALSAIAGSGLAVALSRQEGVSRARRFALATTFAVAGIFVYGSLEPKCLAGPTGQLPAELTPIWLDLVSETRSIATDLVNGRIEQSLGLFVYFALAIAAQAQQFKSTRRASDAFLLAAVAVFTLFACWQYKYMSYASFLAVAPFATWISRIKASAEVSAPVLQIGAAVLISQSALLGASAKLQKIFDAPPMIEEKIRTGAEACETKSAIAADLAGLPAGLIAAHIDLGAYVAASTHHRVLSAPYHRMPHAIIANHHIFAAHDPEQAKTLIAREKVDYVVICKGLDNPFVDKPEWRGTLRARLVAGDPPAFLERVPLANQGSPFSVWRVKTELLNPLP